MAMEEKSNPGYDWKTFKYLRKIQEGSKLAFQNKPRVF